MKNSELPAFPVSGSWNDSHPNVIVPLADGISKREYFAGLAMQGLISSYAGLNISPNSFTVAKVAVEFADDLLARLELTKE